MSEAALPLSLLVLGLASGLHCAGMCGGIVTAFSTQPVSFARTSAPDWLRQLAFNLGRITSYAAAGALAGAFGAGVYVVTALPAQTALFVLANMVLLFAALHLFGVTGFWSRIERLGVPLWRCIQPLAARLLPARTLPQAYAAGAVWGWLPCGLVYSALAAAAFAGGPASGAAAMLAFGIGTLPNLLAAGLAATQVRKWLRGRAARAAAGAAVLLFGAYGLAHAGGIAEAIRDSLLCL
jgi:sulfite exporter TauE/SafE